MLSVKSTALASFQNNTFNSCMSLIIHSRFFGKLQVSSYTRWCAMILHQKRKTRVNLFIVLAPSPRPIRLITFNARNWYCDSIRAYRFCMMLRTTFSFRAKECRGVSREDWNGLDPSPESADDAIECNRNDWVSSAVKMLRFTDYLSFSCCLWPGLG